MKEKMKINVSDPPRTVNSKERVDLGDQLIPFGAVEDIDDLPEMM